MVRTVESHHVEEEGEDDELVLRTTDGSFQQGEGKSGDGKANTNKSKHSKTEQRRRSKINERIIGDLSNEDSSLDCLGNFTSLSILQGFIVKNLSFVLPASKTT